MARRRGEGIRSVRVRILAAMVVVAAVGMTVAGGASFLVQRDRVISQVDERLAAEVEDLRGVAAGPVDRPDQAPTTVLGLLREALTRIVPGSNESSVALIDGRVALAPGTDTAFRLDDDAGFITRVVAEADATRVVEGTARRGDRLLRYVVVPVEVAGDPSRGLYVAAVDLDAETAPVIAGFRGYAAVAALTLVVLGLVGWLVAGRALRPLRLLRATAERAGEHDLSARVPVDGRDEVSELARTVNGMLERIEGAFGAQRRLLDDVGHELRTPLTIVRGHLELLDANRPGDVESTRELALDELDRMAELLGDLTLLARSDDPGFLTTAPVDVAELTASVAARARALSTGHDWAVEASVPEGVVVGGDARRLGEAWLQLAENAVKYTPVGAGPGAAAGIRLASEADATHVRLRVDDDGPGIAEADRERVLQRFVRATDGRGAEGSGLGLSIVLAIAQAHGGTVRMEAAPSGGTRAVIELPRADPASGRRDPA